MTGVWGLFIAGVVGGLAGHRLHLPAGAMVGAIVAIIIYKLLNAEQTLTIPANVILSQIMVGIAIGANFTPNFCNDLKAIMVPAVLSVFLLLTLSGLIAFFLKRYTDLDIATVILSMVPGGLSEMGSFALTFNAKTSVVLTIHLLRILCITLLVPLVMMIANK
jgi:membrane AbrB-like protein